MALKTFVKINSVNNLSDARYCAGMNVNIIGFDVDSVNSEQFKEITSWVSGVEYAAEVNEMKEGLLESYDVEYLESKNQDDLIHSSENIKTIYRTNVEGLNSEISDKIDLILITGEGDISKSDIDLIKSKVDDFKILLGYGINEQNVDRILSETNAYGIALSAGDEIRPGYKDYDELADILEALEIDEWA